jgi:FkbH-like protein
MSAEGLAGLRELRRSGALARHYPEVAALTAGLDDGDLARAGQLLARLDADDVLARHPDVPAVTIAVTGHGTLAPLLPALTGQLARNGLLLRPVTGDLGGWAAELADPGSPVYQADPDLVLCVLDHRAVLDVVAVPWTPADVERALAARLELISGLAARFAASARGTLVLNTLPLPSAVTAQLIDHRSRARLGAAWREANARLLHLADELPAVLVVDLDPLVAEGIAACDPRLSVYARVHLAPALLARYAREIGHLARHLAGGSRKGLAVDLDESVWGGVLGEDGVAGIEVGGDRRGPAFRAFQQVIRQFSAQGVLLAAVSKNDPGLVSEALRGHPEMTLREDDFVRIAANWRPKPDNLTELAADLGLTPDAFVFADDSPFECGLVRRELPGVAVVELAGDPAGHAGALLAGGWFDTRELTREDRARPALYRAEAARHDFLSHFDSLERYLAELGVRVALAPVAEPQVARVSQLTLRTNQFNLTTRRLQPDEVRARAADPATPVLTVHAADRFGDNGLVGAIFLRRLDDTVHLDNFVLSCRVFSRGIEQACLTAVLSHAAATGARAVSGSYRRTAKNAKVADFLPRLGFATVSAGADAAEFRHDLAVIADPPAHVQLTHDLARQPEGTTP